MTNMHYFLAPQAFLQGPVPIDAIYGLSPNMPYYPYPWPPQPTRAPPLPPAPKKDSKKAAAKKDERKDRGAPRPTIRPDQDYMFGHEHTDINVMRYPRKVWEEKYEGKEQYARGLLQAKQRDNANLRLEASKSTESKPRKRSRR